MVNYRAWCDLCWLKFKEDGGWPEGYQCNSISWKALFLPPKSWANRKFKEAVERQRHTAKPDRDNIDKALLDAIFKRIDGHDDCEVSSGSLEKIWVEKDPGLEVTMLFEKME